ncbi:MAG: trypsin-like peptidase domain-containing protein, partial [Terriglobales bacterium]
GVIVDPRGYILTNDHVVHHAAQITVWLYHDAQPYLAQWIGSDRDTDLALLKIQAPHPLPAVRLDGSRALRVGDWVLAIGSPFGLDHSVTAGIVSALGRRVAGENEFERFIQTDAPINPGNSGGPLVNMSGEVVGINTAIYTVSYAYEGVGFALPAALARHVYHQLLRYGRVRRGSIGIYFQPRVPSAVRIVYAMGAGVPIAAVVPNGPAARAGLQPGDVIVAVGGEPVRSGQQLLTAIADRPPGARVRLAYRRRGKLAQVAVAVAERDALFHTAGDIPPPRPTGAPGETAMGLELRSVTAAIAAGQQLPQTSGALVRAVDPGSFASQIGIRRGDVIISLDRHPIGNAEVFRALCRQLRPGQPVAVEAQRQGDDEQWTLWWVGGRYP